MKTDKPTYAAVEAVARQSYGRLVALLAARTRDPAGAEDALADALVAALNSWPRDGVPKNPQAWLLTAARNRLLDDQIGKRQVSPLRPRTFGRSVGPSHNVFVVESFMDERGWLSCVLSWCGGQQLKCRILAAANLRAVLHGAYFSYLSG